MKTILTILICAACAAHAQDLKDPVRVINAQRFSIAPLIAWWTNAQSQVLSNRDNLSKIKLPPRPLPAWVRVRSTQITNTGFVVTAIADIYESPLKNPTTQNIILRHGPFEEKKKVDAAAARYEQATTDRDSQIEWAQFNDSRSKRLGSIGTTYQEVRNAGGGNAFGNLANDYNSASRQASQSADANRNRAANLDAERERLAKITQGRSSMSVDTFALRTSLTYQGMTVYEMGLPFGR